jgi:hypothetical protein
VEAPVEGSGGLVTEGNGPLPPALAEHVDHVVLEAYVADAEAEQLGAASAGVEQEHDDGGVATRDEVPARAGIEQASERVGGHDGDGLLGDVRGAHAGDRVVADLAFLFQPAVQAAERFEAGGGRAGAVPGEQVAEDGPLDGQAGRAVRGVRVWDAA